jgi:alpha-glucosidase
MQYHLFDKNQPENLAWLERIRALLDQYDARASVGEMGESHHAIRMMGEYTAPGRLHQCYSFELMGNDYTPAFFRGKLEEFFTGAPDGWPMWAFSNHDVARHVGRWEKHGATPELLAKQAAALLLSFQGSVCLWQGEELGQTDTALGLAELTDPQGIAFWPEPMGRDGTRTPMVWDGSRHGGFTAGTPWLPVKPPQLARHVAGQTGVAGSVLDTYRQMLGFRRNTPALQTGAMQFHDTPDPILMFDRSHDGSMLTCAFNLSPGTVTLPMTGAVTGFSQNAAMGQDGLTLGPNGFAFLN